jgi:sec-independent protein translocase protein TatC
MDRVKLLRKKAKWFFLTVLFGLIVGWTLGYHFILAVKESLLPPGVSLVALTPLELVVVQLKISIVFTLLLLLPLLLYWLSPPLRKRLGGGGLSVLPWLLTAALFFVGGVSFAYFLLLPTIIGILTENTLLAGIDPLYSLHDFIFFTISMTLILGLIFEFPVAVAWLARMGFVSSALLKEKRKYAYVGIFLTAAVVTPDPSPVSQILVALPFLLFYELSILFSWLFQRR